MTNLVLGIDPAPLTFNVPMRCATKARPRVTSKGTFMPNDYVQWKQTFGVYATKYCRLLSFPGDVSVSIIAQFKQVPRGDADNYAGAVLDALNGITWADDRQVKDLHIQVVRGATDSITVDIQAWQHPDNQQYKQGA